ncbi:MAG: hypothetical protein NTV21_16025 [Planctomycetota bacterium]|nr:hypothetical protein [Planctomycetota bacterium]
MLSLNDERWQSLCYGYRVPFDLRPLLRQLESGDDPDSVWDKLWQELLHQGDIGEGSYAALPHIVSICRARGRVDWNVYALAGSIELARDDARNPKVPDWMREAYDESLRTLATLGLAQLPLARDRETVRTILGFLAIHHGARSYGWALLELSESELIELQRDIQESPRNSPSD